LDEKRSLIKSDFQKFMKRLRKKFKGRKIRYFQCGEYGEQLQRPHFHACLFGFDFPDKELWSVRNGVRLYRSKILEQIWTDPETGDSYGFSTIGDVTFESAAYVARYVTKKINGKEAGNHYEGKTPEYITMSRRPGIAADWAKKFKDDVYPHDFVVVRGGIKCKPPKFYDQIYENMTGEPVERSEFQKKYFKRKEENEKKSKEMRAVKQERIQRAKDDPDNSPERLKVREVVKKASIKNLNRSYEKNET